MTLLCYNNKMNFHRPFLFFLIGALPLIGAGCIEFPTFTEENRNVNNSADATDSASNTEISVSTNAAEYSNAQLPVIVTATNLSGQVLSYLTGCSAGNIVTIEEQREGEWFPIQISQKKDYTCLALPVCARPLNKGETRAVFSWHQQRVVKVEKEVRKPNLPVFEPLEESGSGTSDATEVEIQTIEELQRVPGTYRASVRIGTCIEQAGASPTTETLFTASSLPFTIR